MQERLPLLQIAPRILTMKSYWFLLSRAWLAAAEPAPARRRGCGQALPAGSRRALTGKRLVLLLVAGYSAINAT